MADYAKKKNDELAALCKERNLPHTGKKADLVKRLEEYDAKQAGSVQPAAGEDEIDWDEEPTETAKAATTEPAANAIAAGGIGEVSNPQAVPNQEAAIDPAKTDDLSVVPAMGAAESKSTAPTYNIDEELDKLKKRAEKFGNPPEMLENIKNLERAKKFGGVNEGSGLNMLNQALPEKREKKHGKRGREGDDGGIRKRSRGRPGPGQKEKRGDFPSWMSDKDKEAAERRKAKFATA